MTGKLVSAFCRGIFLASIFSFAHFGGNAQPCLKERRAYYLDAIYSMVKPSKLLEPVINDLANAIDAMHDKYSS